MLSSCALSEEKDGSKWSWEKSGKFTVKSMYNRFHSEEAHKSNRKLWKAKIPLKIKIFMWLVDQNAILTKDNLTKRNWHGDKRCYFCHTDENVSHIFFECPTTKYMWNLVSIVVGADCRPTSFSQFWEWAGRFMPNHKKIHFTGLAALCWAIWRTRNAVCFDKKSVKSPNEIICLASSFISYWSGLHKQGDKQDLEDRAQALK
jgi:hypothetical protein